MSGTRLVMRDCGPYWESRIARRLSDHTRGCLVDRDAVTVGYLAGQVVSRRCRVLEGKKRSWQVYYSEEVFPRITTILVLHVW